MKVKQAPELSEHRVRIGNMNNIAQKVMLLRNASENAWDRAASADRSILATDQFIKDWDTTSNQWGDALVAIVHNDTLKAKSLLEQVALIEARYLSESKAKDALALLT